MLRTITMEGLREMVYSGKPPVIIDARSHKDFEGGHIPGAVSLPSDHIGGRVLSKYDKKDTIVTYCTDLKCEASAIAARKLEKFGFEDVLEFRGGLAEWVDAGNAVEK